MLKFKIVELVWSTSKISLSERNSIDLTIFQFSKCLNIGMIWLGNRGNMEVVLWYGLESTKTKLDLGSISLPV